MANHSIEFDETFNIEQDLIFLQDLSINLTEFFSENSIFIGMPFDVSASQAESVIEVPLENFNELFKIKFTSINLNYENVYYYVDYEKWNNNGIANSPIEFSNSILKTNNLEKPPINPNHSIQSLKRDLSRHIFNYIPNIGHLNNLLTFQNRIVNMIDDMNETFHNNILSELKIISDKGYQPTSDVSYNPIRVLFSSVYGFGNELGYDESDTEIYGRDIRSDMIVKEVSIVIENHFRKISQYCYYIEEIENNVTKYCGPLFISKETLLACSFSLKRYVNFDLQTIDGFEIGQYTNETYEDYSFYYIPGVKYNQGSFYKYDTVEELENNLEIIKNIDVWKGNFSDHTEIIMNFPFIENDKIDVLLTYKPDNLNFRIFNESFGNFGNTQNISERTYQVSLKLKQTQPEKDPIIVFSEVLLALLKSNKHKVNYLVDVVKIRIDLEILIYHKGVLDINDNEKMIIEELKNTSILEFIFESIKVWQYWYHNWYLIGNPIQEQQAIKNSIILNKIKIEELNYTTNIINLLLNNIN